MLPISLLYKCVLPVFLLAGVVAGCNQLQPAPEQLSQSPAVSVKTGSKKPLVVATTSVICDLTQAIAHDTIDLKCLVGAGSDPHVYQPTPADRQAIDGAKLVLYGGYDFEPSLIKIVQGSTSSAPKVAIHEVAVPNPLQGEHEHGQEDHQGTKEADKDPHVWHNAQYGIKMVEVIRASLAQAIPDQANSYKHNAQTLTIQLGQIDTWMKAQIATIPRKSRKLVTTHDALGYYGNAYGIPIDGALQGLSTEEKPTPVGIKKLVDEIKKTGVPTIFAEVTASSKILEQVAKEANVKISEKPLFADGLGEPGSGAETYPKMLIANTQAIVEGLGGKFQALTIK